MAEFQTGPGPEQEFTAQVYEFTRVPEHYHVEQDPKHRPIERPFAPEAAPIDTTDVARPPFVNEVQRRPEVDADMFARNQIAAIGPKMMAVRLEATGDLPKDDLSQYFQPVPELDFQEAA